MQGHEDLFPGAWEPGAVPAGFARRFLTLAESRGIRFFWVIPPLEDLTESFLALGPWDPAAVRRR